MDKNAGSTVKVGTLLKPQAVSKIFGIAYVSDLASAR